VTWRRFKPQLSLERNGWRVWPQDVAHRRKQRRAGAELCLRRGDCVALGRRFSGTAGRDRILEAAQRAFKKIRATLGADALKYIDQFGTMFHQTMVGASDYTKKAELIDELMVGIEDRKAVFITYQSLQATDITHELWQTADDFALSAASDRPPSRAAFGNGRQRL